MEFASRRPGMQGGRADGPLLKLAEAHLCCSPNICNRRTPVITSLGWQSSLRPLPGLEASGTGVKGLVSLANPASGETHEVIDLTSQGSRVGCGVPARPPVTLARELNYSVPISPSSRNYQRRVRSAKVKNKKEEEGFWFLWNICKLRRIFSWLMPGVGRREGLWEACLPACAVWELIAILQLASVNGALIIISTTRKLHPPDRKLT